MAKYRVNTDGPANVPDVHLHLKPGADHQQYLPDDVDEEQLHHHDEQGPLRHRDQQNEINWQTNTTYKCVQIQKI